MPAFALRMAASFLCLAFFLASEFAHAARPKCPPDRVVTNPMCEPVIVNTPVFLRWQSDAGGKVTDRNGVGTGFTVIQRSKNAPDYYNPSYIFSNFPGNALEISAMPGTF